MLPSAKLVRKNTLLALILSEMKHPNVVVFRLRILPWRDDACTLQQAWQSHSQVGTRYRRKGTVLLRMKWQILRIR